MKVLIGEYEMISSKEILEKTGISRATLNNYIALDLVSKPNVQPVSSGPVGARMLGYFPDDTIDKIQQIKRYKKIGLSNEEIKALVDQLHFGQTVGQIKSASQDDYLIDAEDDESLAVQQMPALKNKRSKGEQQYSKASSSIKHVHDEPLSLTLDEIDHPAFMFTHNFELSWYNEAARQSILGNFENLDASSSGRNILEMLFKVAHASIGPERYSLLKLHLGMAKSRLSKTAVLSTLQNRDSEMVRVISDLYDAAIELPYHRGVGINYFDTLDPSTHQLTEQKLVSTCFREGILAVCADGNEATESITEFLTRRDMVIRHLLRKKIPVLTSLAVLVTDLQGSSRICSELPPDEYFELINEIWSSMDVIFRKYYGTHGKHVGDGMVYYFFPQPDSSYIFNAISCALEVKKEIKRISNRWRLKKDWLNDLYLNTAIHEGQEWLGTFQTATSIEFAVLGETINQAARVSDFARNGAIWGTKTLMGKLSSEERSRIDFGVNRRVNDDHVHYVPSSYAQMESLVDLKSGKFDKLKDIATLPITEIRGIRPVNFED
jgi:class 3 adenylate cyclase/DNA-binding transcriptional MerR regulator